MSAWARARVVGHGGERLGDVVDEPVELGVHGWCVGLVVDAMQHGLDRRGSPQRIKAISLSTCANPRCHSGSDGRHSAAVAVACSTSLPTLCRSAPRSLKRGAASRSDHEVNENIRRS